MDWNRMLLFGAGQHGARPGLKPPKCQPLAAWFSPSVQRKTGVRPLRTCFPGHPWVVAAAISSLCHRLLQDPPCSHVLRVMGTAASPVPVPIPSKAFSL